MIVTGLKVGEPPPPLAVYDRTCSGAGVDVDPIMLLEGAVTTAFCKIGCVGGAGVGVGVMTVKV